MVPLTRITGVQFALNPDLIERVDRTPDTIITLVDGAKYIVQETLDEVVLAILEYRAQVLAAANGFERLGESTIRRTRLSAVPDSTDIDAANPVDAAVADGPVLPLAPRRP
ncbi:MAG: flagellar FlbD family protein [Nocardioides sp.]